MVETKVEFDEGTFVCTDKINNELISETLVSPNGEIGIILFGLNGVMAWSDPDLRPIMEEIRILSYAVYGVEVPCLSKNKK